jgi:hypothetical protein
VSNLNPKQSRRDELIARAESDLFPDFFVPNIHGGTDRISVTNITGDVHPDDAHGSGVHTNSDREAIRAYIKRTFKPKHRSSQHADQLPRFAYWYEDRYDDFQPLGIIADGFDYREDAIPGRHRASD